MANMEGDIPEFEFRLFNKLFDLVVPECTTEYLLEVYRLGHNDGFNMGVGIIPGVFDSDDPDSFAGLKDPIIKNKQ